MLGVLENWASEYQAARSRVKAGAPTGNFWETLYRTGKDVKAQIIEKGTANFLATPTGQQVQQEGVRQTVQQYAQDPRVWVTAAVVFAALFLLIGRASR